MFFFKFVRHHTILLNMGDERLLSLPDGRILAYGHAGTSTSSTIVILFSGTLSVGSASRPNPVLLSKSIHFIAPLATLPGYGNLPTCGYYTPYAATIAHDISALIDHLHPIVSDLTRYIGGGSFGTIPAQMLYGAPFENFPAGKYLKGLLLISAFPPFQNDEEKGFVYTKYITWSNYFGIGPPSRYIPFRLLQHLWKCVLQSKLSSQEKAEVFFRKFIIDKMDEEREEFRAWRERRG